MKALAAAVALYGITHLLFSGSSPGLHYDEAWAANFAVRIAEMPGFWPIEAMSPQTHAWHHYIVAVVFKIFGPSVQLFRLAHFALGLGGVLLLARAVARQFQDSRLAPIFVFLAAVQPALVANHRFAIELTSFHVLCFGGMMYFSLSPRRGAPFFAAIFAALGIGSHIFFIAPALAILISALLSAPKPTHRTKCAISWGALLALPFILKLQFTLPERDKAQSLLVLFAVAIVSIWTLPQLRYWSRIRHHLTQIIGFGGLLALPLSAFLFEGNWALLSHFGTLRIGWLSGWGVLPVIGIVYWMLRDQENRHVGIFWCALALCTIAVAPKPTGRYFETLFLTSAAIAAIVWIKVPQMRWSFLAWPLLLSGNLLLPASERSFTNREFRFLFFHDQSRDFLPKQQALEPLVRLGCRPAQVSSTDPRIAESVAFILEEGRGNFGCEGRSYFVRSGDHALEVHQSNP